MPNKKFIGFPDIDAKVEEIATLPMPLYELPRQARVDRELAIITQYHERIAKAIKTFWGHRDCVEYLQKLIMSGGDGAGHSRIGFKSEVVTALINLMTMHEAEYR